MNDDDATTLVDRLAAGLPDSAPPTSLVTDARRVRRQRRGTRSVVSLAAVVVVVAGIAVAPRLLDDTTTAAPAGIVEKPFPDAPPGMKWVGQERVVVAVPQDWAVTDLVCGTTAPYLVSNGVDGL